MNPRQLDIALIDTLRANLPDYLYNVNPSMGASAMYHSLLAICIILVICALIFGYFYNTKNPSNPLFAFVLTSIAISLSVYFFIGIPKYQWRPDRSGEEISTDYLEQVHADMARYGETAGIGSRTATDHLAGLITCSDAFYRREVCKKQTGEPYKYARDWSELEERITLLELSLLTQMEKESRADNTDQHKHRIDAALGLQKGKGE